MALGSVLTVQVSCSPSCCPGAFPTDVVETALFSHCNNRGGLSAPLHRGDSCVTGEAGAGCPGLWFKRDQVVWPRVCNEAAVSTSHKGAGTGSGLCPHWAPCLELGS